MLLEIEEESEKAPKRRNIIRNKIDAAYISHASLFGKLIRAQSDRPQMARCSLQQREVACSRTDHDECDDSQRASPVAASFPGGDHDGNLLHPLLSIAGKPQRPKPRGFFLCFRPG
ncbi:hypothetical protein [Aureimonas sp. OT7]|uniref:hypothetical protein n=1 Tax=Aureimonas sp. OT7 TaxID=2816454 RepID=UPI0019D5892F|nr:hypothetical protein [Aureimonas sp. OT7]